MDRDNTALFGVVWSGFILFASMKKSGVEYTWIYAEKDNILDPNCLTLKEFFANDKFEKNQQTTNLFEKLPGMQRAVCTIGQ